MTTFDRCQGRWVRVLGTAYLAHDCTDCVRRTDVPADVKSVPWMQPPAIPAWPPECPAHVPPPEVML